jgi:FtsZ-binding cell division protein ZapB
MRKLLISILLVLLIVMAALCIKDGINIGPLQVLGVEGINNKNEELTQKINETKTANENYTTMLNKLKQDIESLTKSKEECLSLINISTESQLQEATQTKNYTIEYLWSRVGNHATQEGVTIRMDITSGTIYRNLKFTVTGNYLAITNFITSLENDSTLEFTIDEFSMTQNECTFTVRNVKVQQENTSGSSSSTGTDTNTNTTQTDGTENANETTNS